MHPLKIDPQSLPAELTETELDALVRTLNIKGHNVQITKHPRDATWGAKLDETHPQLENDLWYAIGSLLWVRAADYLTANGYARADNGPVPVFRKGNTRVYLARKLGSLQWYRATATPPSTEPLISAEPSREE